MQFSIFVLSAVTSLVLAAPPSPPVAAIAAKPTLFAAKFYESGDCSGTQVDEYHNLQGACVDKLVTGKGSAVVKINRDLDNKASYTLTGWSRPGCTGSQVLVRSQTDVCTPLNGFDVLSWSHGGN